MLLASADVNVERRTLSDGFKGTDETVAAMSKIAMGIYGARSQKIRALAYQIIQAAGIPEKDYKGEALALGNWVRDRIRYQKDPYGQETIQHPEYTAFEMPAGDCDDQAVLLAALLSSVGVPTRFKVMGQAMHQYSHVYMQAKVGNTWINMDPIMRHPMGWEVPKSKRIIEKTFPVNGPRGLVSPGMQGGQDMGGLGYIGDPRVESHLESPFIPLDAGLGVRGHRAKGRPAYVTMPSGLDTDAGLDHMMAFPPNQNVPARYPQQFAQNIGPGVAPMLTNRGVAQPGQAKRMESRGMAQSVARARLAQQPPRGRAKPAGAPAGPIPQAFFEEAEEISLNGMYNVIGPDAMAGIGAGIDDQLVSPYMQTKTVRQQPEGVDAQFVRAAQVFDPNKGDKIDYYGHFDAGEKPPIRPYDDVAGLDGVFGDPSGQMLPGMSGPGLGSGSTGALGVDTSEPLPAGAPVMTKTLGFGAIATIAAVVGAGIYMMNRA